MRLDCGPHPEREGELRVSEQGALCGGEERVDVADERDDDEGDEVACHAERRRRRVDSGEELLRADA